MNIAELTEFLVKSVVRKPDMVSVKGFETDEGYIVEVLVAEDDMCYVIGKGGKIVHAIRTLVSSSAYASGQKHVKINIDSK